MEGVFVSLKQNDTFVKDKNGSLSAISPFPYEQSLHHSINEGKLKKEFKYEHCKLQCINKHYHLNI